MGNVVVGATARQGGGTAGAGHASPATGARAMAAPEGEGPSLEGTGPGGVDQTAGEAPKSLCDNELPRIFRGLSQNGHK